MCSKIMSPSYAFIIASAAGSEEYAIACAATRRNVSSSSVSEYAADTESLPSVKMPSAQMIALSHEVYNSISPDFNTSSVANTAPRLATPALAAKRISPKPAYAGSAPDNVITASAR